MTNFSKIAHHFLGTGLTVSLHGKQYELLGIEPKGFLLSGGFASWGPETKPHFRSLNKLTQPIRVEGEEPFVPIERLNAMHGFTEVRLTTWISGDFGWSIDPCYGSTAIGFMSDFFPYFQQLLSWHFNLFSVPEGEFIEIEETTNTPEAGEK